MMKSVIQWVRLFMQVIEHGRLPKLPFDYQAARMRGLQNLDKFHPRPLKTPGTRRSRIPFQQAFIGQIAFFKQASFLSARHLFVPHLKLAYIRNPKAASTSLSLLMLENIYPGLTNELLSAEQINFLADLNLHSQIVPEEKEAIFFIVVRNPFDRLVSVYREFFERPSDRFIYDDYLFGILRKDFSFAEFVARILMIPDVLLDQHLKPQTCFLKFYERRNVNLKILKIEDGLELTHFLARYDLVLPEVNRNPLPLNYCQYYDSFTLHKVSQLYANDIKVLGYTQEYEALKKNCAHCE